MNLLAFRPAWLVMPLTILLVSCGGATSDATSEHDARTCTINYSVHPIHGGARMGDERRSILQKQLGNGFDGSALARELSSFSIQMIEELRRDLTLPPFEVDQVRGGYKGTTSDSLTASARYIGQVDEATFSHLTSAIGYVFMQDGMILQCSLIDGAEETAGVPALILNDVGDKDDLQLSSVAALYAGMLEATGFEELGFTYEKAIDALTILIFSEDGEAERAAMAWALNTLNKDEGQAEVALTEDQRSVLFLGHRWEDDASGTDYVQTLEAAFEQGSLSLSQLDQYQNTYLSIIDRYADER
ncbi:MAG: hypothetical protein AAFX52_05425 [Pseudomonadota bacterium]